MKKFLFIIIVAFLSFSCATLFETDTVPVKVAYRPQDTVNKLAYIYGITEHPNDVKRGIYICGTVIIAKELSEQEKLEVFYHEYWRHHRGFFNPEEGTVDLLNDK